MVYVRLLLHYANVSMYKWPVRIMLQLLFALISQTYLLYPRWQTTITFNRPSYKKLWCYELCNMPHLFLLKNITFNRRRFWCDVPEMIQEQQHDYSPLRNQTIHYLTEYKALHFTNFTKSQLMRKYMCFNFGYDWIRLHYSLCKFYRECPEYVSLFVVVKMSSGLDTLSLCAP